VSVRPLWFLPALALLACKPNEAAFYQKTYFCEASNHRPQCGTTESGAPLMCFGGRQLGAGRDFCVERCTTEAADPGCADSICLTSAKLKSCRPSEKTAEDPDGCGPDLACLRTDLARDEGVCLATRVCTTDTDCTDPVLSTCGASIVKALYPNAPFVASNLQCMMGGCKARQTACPTGETCLPMVVPPSTAVPDICVPTCDSNLNCPPNYACWRKLSGPGSPDVCLPTLPGARCTTSLDCMGGECLDTGEGFSLCSLPCETNADCVPFSDSSRKQYCVQARPDRKYCMSVTSFAGTLCTKDEDCSAPKKCYFTSPAWPDRTLLGECRLTCDPGDRCAVRTGVPHACFVRGEDRSCYPGTLGVTCQRSEECIAGMTCEVLPAEERLSATDGGRDAGADGAVPSATRVCARPCTADVDCLDGWKQQEGYCEAGWCRMGVGEGGRCTRDQQCGRHRCQLADGGAAGVCTPR
jgi:hypothetical protein